MMTKEEMEIHFEVLAEENGYVIEYDSGYDRYEIKEKNTFKIILLQMFSSRNIASRAYFRKRETTWYIELCSNTKIYEDICNWIRMIEPEAMICCPNIDNIKAKRLYREKIGLTKKPTKNTFTILLFALLILASLAPWYIGLFVTGVVISVSWNSLIQKITRSFKESLKYRSHHYQ